MSWTTTYRPATIKEVVGQEYAKDALGQLVNQGQRSVSSIILSGPSGTGKTTLARAFASEMGCKGLDLMEVNAAVNTGIADMRVVQQDAMLRPVEGSTRFVIVDEAHSLSRQAWNSLLKAVEEPPATTWWVFVTTEPTKIIDTIRNRCLHLELVPVAMPDIVSLLRRIAKAEQLRLKKGLIDEIARCANGSPRRAVVLLASCHQMDAQEVAKVASTITEEGTPELVEMARAMFQGASFQDLRNMLEGVSDWEGARRFVLAWACSIAFRDGRAKLIAKAARVIDVFSTQWLPGAEKACFVSCLVAVTLGE